MKYGLTEDTIQKIQDVFTTFPQIEKAVIFGSRVKGNYKKGSDIDLTLHGAELTTKLLRKIENELDELLLPYKIDLSVFHLISNPDFIEHILRVGKVFYEKSGDFGKDSGDVMKRGGTLRQAQRGELESWKVEKLGDVLQKTETVNPTLKPNQEFLYVDVSSVNNQTFLIEDASQLIGKDAPSRARKLIKTDDVIFATVRPTLKRIAIVPEEYDNQVCSTGYFVLRPREFISNKYLFYFLLSDEFMGKMEKLQKGASYPAVTDNEVKSQPIAYPPLPEQQRIVSLLDETFAALAQVHANAERNLVNTREVFESVLAETFENKSDGWDEKELQNIVDANCTLSYGIVQPGEEYADGLPVIRPTDMTRRVITLDGLKRINPQLADSYQRTTLTGNELLLCVRGSTGTVSITSAELKGANVTRGIVPIRFNSEFINQEFGYYLLVSNYVQKQIKEKTYGAALMQINIGDLRKILVPFPPLAEQRAIVARLDVLSAETKKLEGIYEQKIAALEELKKSVLSKAFGGEM